MFLTGVPLLAILVVSFVLGVVAVSWRLGMEEGFQAGFEEGRDAGFVECGWAFRHAIGAERFQTLVVELQDRQAGIRSE